MANGTAVTQWDERFAKVAEQYAQEEKTAGDFLSTRGGVLTFQEEQLPGNQIVVVILESVKERTYYTERFDPNREHNMPPVCYAFARMGEEEEMAPHLESMKADKSYFEPQNDICATCPHNEWGSSDTGRGKACSERRRLALLPAGFYSKKKGTRNEYELELFTEEEHFATADIAMLKLPTTSLKQWGKYVATLSSQYRRPPFGVVTRIYLEPDPKNQFVVKFEMIDLLPAEMIDTIVARHEEAGATMITGYAPPSAEAKQGASGSKKIRRR